MHGSTDDAIGLEPGLNKSPVSISNQDMAWHGDALPNPCWAAPFPLLCATAAAVSMKAA